MCVCVNIYKQTCEIFIEGAICEEGLHIKDEGTAGEDFFPYLPS